MPWKESKPMDERLRFVARLLEGEKMAPLCREFGISRVTGYKIYERYKECGLDGLNDRSRRPYRQSRKLPFQIERTILGIKREHPSWGAPKIRDKLVRQYPMVKTPAISTIHAVLDRNGLVKRRKRRRHKARGTALEAAHEPNGLWCADYKGEFKLGNKQYCYPLTITDYRSRYLITCEGLTSIREKPKTIAPALACHFALTRAIGTHLNQLSPLRSERLPPPVTAFVSLVQLDG